MPKIGIVYTSTTPQLIELVEQELKNVLSGEADFVNFEDASILAEVREAGYVTATATARLVGLYVNAINSGADVILNCCSSVGEVADCVQNMAKFSGIPIVRIDEEMCRAAVRAGKKIAVMATLSSTLEPTKNTLKRVAREMNKQIELVDALLEGAFGLSPEEFTAKMVAKASEVQNEADVILFAQGSMAYCENIVAQKTKKEVFSSPRFGAAAVKCALQEKGLVE